MMKNRTSPSPLLQRVGGPKPQTPALELGVLTLPQQALGKSLPFPGLQFPTCGMKGLDQLTSYQNTL